MKIKKMLAAISTLCMIAAISVGCTSEDSSESESAAESVAEESVETVEDSSEEETEAPTEAPTEAQEFAFEITGTSLSKDYDDSDVLVVTYNFTNNSDSATSFSFACQDTAFQNGVECDSTIISCPEIDAQQQLNDIQPGTTYTLNVGYHLQDLTSPVTIQVTDLFGDETFLDQEITLQ